MSDPMQTRRVIPSQNVRRDDAPVLVDCAAPGAGRARAMTVIPLTEDGEVRGFEVRCPCGSTVIVECVYEEGGRAP